MQQLIQQPDRIKSVILIPASADQVIRTQSSRFTPLRGLLEAGAECRCSLQPAEGGSRGDMEHVRSVATHTDTLPPQLCVAFCASFTSVRKLSSQPYKWTFTHRGHQGQRPALEGTMIHASWSPTIREQRSNGSLWPPSLS